VYANNEHKEGKEEQPIEDEDNEYEQPIEDEDEEEQPIDEEQPIEQLGNNAVANDANDIEADGAPATMLDQEMDARYGARSGHYGLRPRRPRDHSHLHTIIGETVMTQHSLKRGIKVFGNAGVEAVLKELQQLHDRKVLEPKNAATLTQDKKRAAQQCLMFLKQKRNGSNYDGNFQFLVSNAVLDLSVLSSFKLLGLTIFSNDDLVRTLKFNCSTASINDIPLFLWNSLSFALAILRVLLLRLWSDDNMSFTFLLMMYCCCAMLLDNAMCSITNRGFWR
jgi:hypothetical protein